MMQTVLVQALGFLAAACFICSYQIKSNKALFILQTLASCLFCLQFFMLGGISGCFNLLVVIVRNLMLLGSRRYRCLAWKGWIGVIAAVCMVILIGTWQNLSSLLPFAAMIGSTIGYWTNNAQKIRLCNLVCACPAWMAYDICIGSLGGILNEIVGITSILVSIYRYGWKNMGEAGFADGKEAAADPVFGDGKLGTGKSAEESRR